MKEAAALGAAASGDSSSPELLFPKGLGSEADSLGNASRGDRRDAALFVARLGALRRRYRWFRVIHVGCDNARFRAAAGSQVVGAYPAEWGDRVRPHYLPSYAPDANPVERVLRRMHERVNRNRRCPDLDSPTDMVFRWLAEERTFSTESRFYPTAMVA
jgi:transposase